MKSIPEKYRNDISIIRDTAKQISRDFNIDGFEVNFSGNETNAFEEFKQQITPVLMLIYRNDRFAFQNLLYRIDINEKDYKKLISTADSGNFESDLTELVIRREFQKVLTRKYFSSK
jgi:hypothetical protein